MTNSPGAYVWFVAKASSSHLNSPVRTCFSTRSYGTHFNTVFSTRYYKWLLTIDLLKDDNWLNGFGWWSKSIRGPHNIALRNDRHFRDVTNNVYNISLSLSRHWHHWEKWIIEFPNYRHMNYRSFAKWLIYYIDFSSFMITEWEVQSTSIIVCSRIGVHKMTSR